MQDKGQKPNKFLYQGTKQKIDTWRSQDDGSQYATQYFQLGGTSNANTLANLNFKGPAFDLDSAWSIRKNVPLPGTAKQLNTAATSFYSRHVNTVKGTNDSTTSSDSKKFGQVTHANANENAGRGWNFRKPEYSYGTLNSSKRQLSDNDGELSGSVAKKGNFRTIDHQKSLVYPMAAGRSDLSNRPERKQSARTQRAQNLYNSYLKSAGLGEYTPDESSYPKDENKPVSKCRQKSASSDRSF